MPKPVNVISYWSQLIENFQGSSQEFYQAFSAAVNARAVPQTQWVRVEHNRHLCQARQISVGARREVLLTLSSKTHFTKETNR